MPLRSLEPSSNSKAPLVLGDEDHNDNSGLSAFPRLVPGDYMLTVTHASFQDERYRLSLKPRKVQILELALALRPVQESVQIAADAIPSVFSSGSTHFTANGWLNCR